MVGTNWLISPTHSASGSGKGMPMKAKAIQWTIVEKKASSAAAVDVATGLLDGDLPHPQHLDLPLLGQHRQDRPAQAGAVGHQVEGEEDDRQELEEHGERPSPRR